jgi:hypothetical protein
VNESGGEVSVCLLTEATSTMLLLPTLTHQIRKAELESPDWLAKHLGAYYNTSKIMNADVRQDAKALVFSSEGTALYF